MVRPKPVVPFCRSQLAALALALTAAACGRSVRSDSGKVMTAAGAGGGLAGRGRAGATGGTGTGGTAGSAGAGITVAQEDPLSARHVSVGAPAPTGCFTSLVPTRDGMAFAGVGSALAFSGTTSPDATYGWRSEVEALPNTARYALVTGDETGRVVAWSDGASPGLTLRRYDAAGALIEELQYDDDGDPVAATGSVDDYAFLLAGTNGATLLHVANGSVRLSDVGPSGCVTAESAALGRYEGDVVVAYYCGLGATSMAPEAEHLVVAREDRVGGAVERVIVNVDLTPTYPYSGTGAPGVSWGNDEFLFAYLTPAGDTVLSRVTPGDPEPRTTVVTGLPSTAFRPSNDSPRFSVLAVGDQVALTRSICYGHEDAGPTGAVAVCNVAADGVVASCTQVEAPCWTAKLVAVGADVELLACGRQSARSIVPVDLGQLPAGVDGIFPTGFATYEPLALDCHGDDCSTLLRIDSTRATTGYDSRLAFAELTFADGCSVDTCQAERAEPAGVNASTDDDFSPTVTLERQARGFPLAVLTIRNEDRQQVPTLTLLARDGARWSQSVPSTNAAVYARGAGFAGLTYDLPTGFYQLLVDEHGVTSGQAVALPRSPAPPSTALCGDRILVHSLVPYATGSPARGSIFSVDPATFETAELFDAGVYPPGDSSKPPMPLGCAGDLLVLLDGTHVHRYALADGTRAPVIELAAPPLVTRVESATDHVLVASAPSGVDAIDALFLFTDGSVRSFRLPLPPGSAPLTSLTVAPDRGDDWLRVLYSVAHGAPYQGALGAVFASAFELPR